MAEIRSDQRTVDEFAPGLFLEVRRPATDSVVPAAIWLHGGAWRMGDYTWGPDGADVLLDAGIAIVSADYRLSTDAPFPAQLLDVRAAIRWVRDHADWYGIDPEAIGIWGSSAGGHLAALAGLTGSTALLDGENADATSAAVMAVVDGYGAADLLAPDQDVPPTRGLLGGSIAEHADVARAASPALVDAEGAPPFLILHGTADPLMPPSQSIALFESLAAAGVDATLYLIDGFGHGFLNPAGSGELDGPPLDDGRLSAEPHPAATVRHALDGRIVRVDDAPEASYRLISDFFLTHLMPHAIRSDNDA